jgi:hypothetical protein
MRWSADSTTTTVTTQNLTLDLFVPSANGGARRWR